MNPAATSWLLIASALLLVAPRRAAEVPRTEPARRGRRPPDAALPLVLDLVAAALRTGRPVFEALELAGAAGAPETAHDLLRVARLLRLGADPPQAWASVAGPVRSVVPVAVRSASSGLKLAAAFERLAAELRADRAAVAASRAQRAGVFALAPLGACFLPSFVCLGVIPTVVGIAGKALGISP